MTRRLALLALAGMALAPPARAGEGGRTAAFVTPAAALAEAFPGARLERRSTLLTPAQVKQVQQRARVKIANPLVTPWLAWRGDTLAGVALFDSRTVRTMPAVLMTVVAPDSTIRSVEVLSFHEPPDYRPPARWLGLFGRRRLDDRLWPGRDLPALSGATLSARAVTESARLAAAIWEVAVAPGLARKETR